MIKKRFGELAAGLTLPLRIVCVRVQCGAVEKKKTQIESLSGSWIELRTLTPCKGDVITYITTNALRYTLTTTNARFQPSIVRKKFSSSCISRQVVIPC